MLFGNTVEFAQMSLRLVPKVLNAVDVILLVCKKFGMVDATVLCVNFLNEAIAEVDRVLRLLRTEGEKGIHSFDSVIAFQRLPNSFATEYPQQRTFPVESPKV
jgi:hypothetical protein